MDRLKDQDKVELWNSSWRYSLSGMAILRQDFSFYSVNSQWMKILQQPAHVFYGKKFTEITSPEVRDADEAQAKLLIEGKIESYLMHKSYQFPDGNLKAVTQLVTRVPLDTGKPFKFFLSRILLRAEKPSTATQSSQISDTDRDTNSKWAKVVEFVLKYWVTIAVGSAAAFGAIKTFFMGA